MIRNRTFLIAMGVFASYVLAFELLSFSLPLLALEISGTGTGLALIKGAGFIPNILFAIFIGVINDRIRKAAGFRVYTAVLAACTALLWLAMISGHLSVGGMAVFMIVFNATGYALGNMQLTLIRLVVPERQLADATALTSGVHSTISTVAPALGGLAILWLGHTNLTGLVTALLGLCAFAAFAVRPPEASPAPAPFWAALKAGWHAFATNRDLVMMTIAVILTNAAAGAADVGLVLKLKTALSLDSFTLGLVLAAAGFGAVLTASVAAPIRRKIGPRMAFYWPILILAAIYLGMMASTSVILLAGLSFLEGAVSSFYNISIWSYRQESVSAAHMGRVAGITGAIFKLGLPPMILLSGLLADTGTLWATFSLAALVSVSAALFLSLSAKWGLPRRIQ